MVGRWYSQCGRWNSHWVFIFILILVLWCYSEPPPINEADDTCLCFCSGMDCWPLMYIASFISLMRFWSSLPTMLKLSSVVLWPAMVLWSWIGGGVCEMFFKPLSKCPGWLSYIIFIAFHPVTLIPIYDATPFDDVVFIFGCHQEVFDENYK